MSESIVLHELQYFTRGNNFVMLQIVIPSQVELDKMRKYIADLKLEDEENMYYPGDFGVDDELPTEETLAFDKERLEYWLSDNVPWELIFPKIARKANGTFHKNRVIPLHRIGSSEHGYSEESFGFYGDELRIRNVSDTTAVLTIENVIRKYDEDRHSFDPADLTQ